VHTSCDTRTFAILDASALEEAQGMATSSRRPDQVSRHSEETHGVLAVLRRAMSNNAKRVGSALARPFRKRKKEEGKEAKKSGKKSEDERSSDVRKRKESEQRILGTPSDGDLDEEDFEVSKDGKKAIKISGENLKPGKKNGNSGEIIKDDDGEIWISNVDPETEEVYYIQQRTGERSLVRPIKGVVLNGESVRKIATSHAKDGVTEAHARLTSRMSVELTDTEHEPEVSSALQSLRNSPLHVESLARADIHSVDDLLKALDMPDYSAKFAEEKIDLPALFFIKEDHLLEMDFKMGDRIKMLRMIRLLQGLPVDEDDPATKELIAKMRNLRSVKFAENSTVRVFETTSKERLLGEGKEGIEEIVDISSDEGDSRPKIWDEVAKTKVIDGVRESDSDLSESDSEESSSSSDEDGDKPHEKRDESIEAAVKLGKDEPVSESESEEESSSSDEEDKKAVVKSAAKGEESSEDESESSSSEEEEEEEGVKDEHVDPAMMFSRQPLPSRFDSKSSSTEMKPDDQDESEDDGSLSSSSSQVDLLREAVARQQEEEDRDFRRRHAKLVQYAESESDADEGSDSDSDIQETMSQARRRLKPLQKSPSNVRKSRRKNTDEYEDSSDGENMQEQKPKRESIGKRFRHPMLGSLNKEIASKAAEMARSSKGDVESKIAERSVKNNFRPENPMAAVANAAATAALKRQESSDSVVASSTGGRTTPPVTIQDSLRPMGHLRQRKHHVDIAGLINPSDFAAAPLGRLSVHESDEESYDESQSQESQGGGASGSDESMRVLPPYLRKSEDSPTPEMPQKDDKEDRMERRLLRKRIQERQARIDAEKAEASRISSPSEDSSTDEEEDDEAEIERRIIEENQKAVDQLKYDSDQVTSSESSESESGTEVSASESEAPPIRLSSSPKVTNESEEGESLSPESAKEAKMAVLSEMLENSQGSSRRGRERLPRATENSIPAKNSFESNGENDGDLDTSVYDEPEFEQAAIPFHEMYDLKAVPRKKLQRYDEEALSDMDDISETDEEVREARGHSNDEDKEGDDGDLRVAAHDLGDSDSDSFFIREGIIGAIDSDEFFSDADEGEKSEFFQQHQKASSLQPPPENMKLVRVEGAAEYDRKGRRMSIRSFSTTESYMDEDEDEDETREQEEENENEFSDEKMDIITTKKQLARTRRRIVRRTVVVQYFEDTDNDELLSE